MFKDVFVLKKSSYHAKMMSYIWGLKATDFSHMCPYWWLSVFNHFVIFIVFPVKGGWKLFKYILKILYLGISMTLTPPYNAIMKGIEQGNNRREIRWQAKQKIKREKEQAEWKKWSAYYKEHPEKLLEIQGKNESVYDNITEKLRRWHWDDWQEIRDKVFEVEQTIGRQQWAIEAEETAKQVAQALQKKKEQFLSFYQGDDVEALLSDGSFEVKLKEWEGQKRQNQIEAEAARQRANKARINRILKLTKPITAFLAYTLGSAAVLVALYCLWKFIYWCYEGFTSVKHTTYVHIGGIIKYTALALLFIAVLVGIVFLVLWLIKKIDERGIKFPKWLTFRYYFPRKPSKYTNQYWEKKYTNEYWQKKNAAEERGRVFRKKYVYKPVEKFAEFFIFIWNKIICRIGRAIRNAVIFVIQMLKNNCPAIRWED